MLIQQFYFDVQINGYDDQLTSTEVVLKDLAKLLDEAS